MNDYIVLIYTLSEGGPSLRNSRRVSFVYYLLGFPKQSIALLHSSVVRSSIIMPAGMSSIIPLNVQCTVCFFCHCSCSVRTCAHSYCASYYSIYVSWPYVRAIIDFVVTYVDRPVSTNKMISLVPRDTVDPVGSRFGLPLPPFKPLHDGRAE